jgi:protocatechuate 3,4-dioxygenase beta subunit
MKKHKLFNIIIIAFLSFFCLLIQDTFAGDQLVRTPADYEGPFYPITKQLDIDNNLTQVKGQAGVAKGDILNLSGIVVNAKGEPLTDITIEIWQTDPQGRYKHPGDSTPGERDPYFQYWGAAVTDKDGTFFFKTVLPGAYEPRPAHIHYKVLKEGKVILTSQIYFMKPSDKTRLPSMTSGIELQTVDLESDANEEFEAFFRIVI